MFIRVQATCQLVSSVESACVSDCGMIVYLADDQVHLSAVFHLTRSSSSPNNQMGKSLTEVQRVQFRIQTGLADPYTPTEVSHTISLIQNIQVGSDTKFGLADKGYNWLGFSSTWKGFDMGQRVMFSR
ncbi:hypothetical protein Tco_0616252 [Tanacetum coccineum]